LIVVVLLFGTKRLRNLGADMGATIKNFRTTMVKADKRDRIEPDPADVYRLIETAGGQGQGLSALGYLPSLTP
jgi:sec-independent protein translocase protein TatA